MTRSFNLGGLFTLAFLSFHLSLTATAHAADLPVIGIAEIKAPVDDRYWVSGVHTKAENFQVMLETQLSKVGRFKIIERNRIGEVLAEQGMNNAFGDGQTAHGKFHVEGVDYLVYGAITDFGYTQKSVGTDKFKSQQTFTNMSVDLKIVDARDGAVKLAETVSQTLETGNSLTTEQFSNDKSDKAPLTRIQRLVAQKLAGVIATTIFPMEVIKGGDTIYINYGDAILNTGDKLKVYRLGERLTDPSTGLDLGAEETETSEIEIIEVTPKFSKARLLSGTPPSPGNRVRIDAKSANGPAQSAPTRRGRQL